MYCSGVKSHGKCDGVRNAQCTNMNKTETVDIEENSNVYGRSSCVDNSCLTTPYQKLSRHSGKIQIISKGLSVQAVETVKLVVGY